MLFSLISFETQTCTIIGELLYNIISTANSVYVMCIYLIYYGLGCDVNLPTSFVILDGLPGLYKWKYVRVNMLNGDNHSWSCINWVVLSQLVSEQD